MKKACKILVFLFMAFIFLPTLGYADNPIVQTLYTADPAPMIYDGTCYVYTSHDEDTLINDFFTMTDWRCYSTTDMVNWTDRGAVASLKNFSWAGSNGAWAAQCIYRNGKFYLYCPIHLKGIGVLVSDSPYGPFTDPLGKPLINNSMEDIDPTVFIDDDGQAYMYWGNPNLYYVKLNENMISYSGGISKIPLTTASFGTRSNSERPTSYEEGPWFYKRNGLYYMVFAGGPISEHIAYSTSTGPTGPWTYRGKIMPTQGGSFTNHPGVIDYKGNSYFFYHNGALPGGGGFHRSVCVEQFKYNADGTFPTINMSTTGAPQIGNLDPYVKTEGETVCGSSGVRTEKCNEGGMNVCNIENGDYIKVKGVDFGSGATSFDARVSSATSGGNIELRLDSPTGKLIGTCAVSGTGGWQTWATKSCNISGVSGVHDLYLKFTGGSGFLMNLNWWKFDGNAPSQPRSAFERIEGESYDIQSGIQSVSSSEGGEAVGYTENGDYTVYKKIDFGTGAGSFQARTSSDTSGGKIEIRLDSITGPVVGSCTVPGTGGWQVWTDVKCNVSGVSGEHDLYLKYTGGSGYLFNIDWFKFSQTSTPDGKLGDLNGDGNVNSIDYAALKLHLTDAVPLTGGALSNADVNADGVVNSVDYALMRQYLLGIISVFPGESTPEEPEDPEEKFHCFLLLGQSNMAGYAKSQASDKGEDPRVLVLGYDNNASLGRVTDQWDVACPPLHASWLDAIGPGDWFGKTMIQKVPEGDTIGLIPCAISGEKIETFMKNGGSKYNWIVNRAKLAQQKGGVIEGIIFHQGESNSGDTSWPGKVSTLVNDLKKDLNLGDIPFLAGELLYSGPCAGHNTQVNKLPSLIKNCYVVSADGLLVDSSDTTYRLHFGHDSTVTLGKRYAEKMIQVLGW
ncbi:dockerin type I repeat protein [Anaerobacterium chartisolvens]|uniref:Dockerin type I repeat protein n=1 Tax=Anaerobacterium chartisolvens TaxID=1297424 RepID=A0A369B572_9FIRM|nr:carbohydrate-binding protein [Anaerobacterium chartisolvens]RCX14834.1 dockerin type I repeat protein [Anaerobacterium chartisolvens]